MSDFGIFDRIPLGLLFLLVVLVTQASVELGFRLGRSAARSSDPERDSSIGAIVGATLGLLGFMLAFTFGMAASRFDDRRRVVLDEANAIGTAYLRAGLLAQPESDNLRQLLRKYVQVRLDAVQSGKLGSVIQESGRLHEQFWAQASIAAERDKSAVTAIFIESLNEVIDLHATRVQAGLRSRIPGLIWAVLVFVAVLGMTAMGYQVGITNANRSIVAQCLVLTFAAVFFLIAELDRPHVGLIRVSQQSLQDLADSMVVPKESP